MDRKGEDVASRKQRIRKQESRGVLQNQALGGEVQKAEGHQEVQRSYGQARSRSMATPQLPLCLSFPSLLVGLSYPHSHVQGRYGCPGNALGSL